MLQVMPDFYWHSEEALGDSQGFQRTQKSVSFKSATVTNSDQASEEQNRRIEDWI